MENLLTLVDSANSVLWNVILIVLLCGTGIYYTIRLKFIQIRKFPEGLKHVFGNLNLNGEKGNNGEMTPFQSVATAIAAQVGTGNLAGAATALVGGGPGAIFWMWLSAFFGMATIYAEATLAQEYKTVEHGEVTGGPVYYIHAAFKGTFGKVLGVLFSIFIILALGFMGNMVQSNSIGAAFAEVFAARNINIPAIAIGLVLAVLTGFIFVGGTTRLAAVVEKIVPIMAGIYIIGSLVVILLNINSIPTAFMQIIVGAFKPNAVLGGAAGITVREAIRYGVARGLFSNEAEPDCILYPDHRCHGKRKEWNSPDSVCIFLCTGKLWRHFHRCLPVLLCLLYYPWLALLRSHQCEASVWSEGYKDLLHAGGCIYHHRFYSEG